MSMTTPRQTIMMRKLKPPSNKNQENIDIEYEKEQERLRMKQMKYQELEENRRKSLWGNPEEKRELQERRRKEIDSHLSVKESIKKREAMHDMEVTASAQQVISVYDSIDRDQSQARREYLKSLMIENKQLMEARERQRREEKQRQIMQERESVDFFDRLGRSFR